MRKILFAIALALMTSVFAQAETYSSLQAMEFGLNHFSNEQAQKHQMGTSVVRRRMYAKKCTYSFAIYGGAISTWPLRDELGANCKLPKNAIVWSAVIDNLSASLSSGSATIAVSTGQTTADIKAATAVASYTGLLAAIPVGTAASAIKLTADSSPTMTIATAALYDGKFNVLFNFEISDSQ